MRLLVEGDHFGEIAMVYGCARTCPINSRNYNTMASLTYNRYRMLRTDYPSFDHAIKSYIFKYTGPRITFIKSTLR